MIEAAGVEHGKLLVIDWGLCKTFRKKEKMTGICGTVGYKAPEMLEGYSYDEKVDMFSSGVVLWLMLTGHHPFLGDTGEASADKSVKSGN